jgi:hypothetical protein
LPGSFTPLDIDTTILHGFHRVRDLDELSSCGVRISEGVALDVPLIVPVTVAFHRGTHLRKGETLISPWLSMSPADQLFE